MPPQLVTYNAASGQLDVEIYVGNLVYAHYLIKGTIPPNPSTTILSGSNLHPATASFTPTNNQGVSWECVINRLPNGDPGWILTATIRQGGKTLYSAPYKGQFTDDTSDQISGGVLLVAQ